MMTTTRSAGRSATIGLMRRPAFALLWLAQFISSAGSALTTLAASLLIYRLTGSALNVGLMLIASALPSLLVGLVAGAVVDRMQRKAILIAADLLRALVIVLVPALLPSGIGWLYLLVALSSAVGQFFDPALASVLPELVRDEELPAANALMQISTVGASTVGFAAAGLIAAFLPLEWVFFLDAATYIVSAFCIAAVRLPTLPAAAEEGRPSVIGELGEGLRFLWGTAPLRSLLAVCVPALFAIGLLNALLLPLTQRALGADELGYGLIESPSSAGFIVGSLLMAGLSHRLHEGQWIALSYLAVGLSGVAMAQTTTAPAAVLVYTIAGAVNAPNYVGRSTLIQRHTPRELRGRVTSVFLVARNVLYMLGMGVAGLADLLDVRLVYLAGCGLVLVGGGLALVLPGLAQPMSAWRRVLRQRQAAPALHGGQMGYAATGADLAVLERSLPEIGGLGPRAASARRQNLGG